MTEAVYFCFCFAFAELDKMRTKGAKEMKEYSRRDFLKGTAVGVIGLSGLSLITGCNSTTAPAEKGSELTWDQETEIIVVGTGTVITAAIAACEMGISSITVLEKDENIFGGTSTTSGGGYALPGFLNDFKEENNGDSREKCLAYMQAVGEDRMSLSVMESFVDHAQEYCDWTRQALGWSRFIHSGAHNDYYDRYPESIVVGRGSAFPLDQDNQMLMAGAQWKQYREYIDTHDQIELMMGTAAEELIVDENRQVIGVIARQGEKTLRIKAAKGVILGTGGFDYNEAMRRNHLSFPLYRSCSSRNNTGDGQKMGARLGAQLALMDRVMGVPFIYDNPVWNPGDDRNYGIMATSALADWACYLKFPHAICVNAKGERFADESREYDVFSRAFSAYDTGTLNYENIPGYFICDADYTSQFKLPGGATVEALPDYIQRYDSLEALAAGMGIDPAGLLKQVEAFNSYVDAGADLQWHRGESENALRTLQSNSYMALPGTDFSQFTTLTATLGKIEKAPFYCCRYVPGTCGTRGGLLTDGQAQVLDQDNKPIAGLYAVGTCSAGVAGYWAGGACISQGCVMAYVAAKQLAAQ